MPFPAATRAGEYGVLSVCCRAADWVLVAELFAPPLPTLAVPEEGRGMLVPGLCGLLEPVADLGGAVRVLPVKGATLENALDGLGHTQPAASKRRVERHDTVPAKPEHHLGVLVAGEIVPHK